MADPASLPGTGAQSRLMSLVEAITNVVVGFALAFATQLFVFPHFGLRVSVTENVLISCIFTVVSIARGYLLRRLFERIRLRAAVSRRKMAVC